MLRWVAGVLLVVSVASSPCLAATRQSAFSPVPTTDAAYTWVRRLEARGYFTGAESGAFSVPGRVFTRYEFAVAVEQLSQAIQTRVFAASERGMLPEDLRDYRRLVKTFSAEIEGLGPDVDTLLRQVEAMDQRLERLGSSPTTRTASYGLMPRLRSARSERSSAPADAPVLSGMSANDFRPGFTSHAGPLNLSLQVRRPDALDSADLPLDNPSDANSYRARLNLPFGGYTISAFYNREGNYGDRYLLANPWGFPGRTVNVGGGFSADVRDNLKVLLESASVRSLDDELARALSFRAGLNYEIGRGLQLGASFEKIRQISMPGLITDLNAYTLYLEGRWGRSASLSLIYRYFSPLGGTSPGSLPRSSDQSAVVQTTIRF